MATAIYIDADAGAFTYRDAAQRVLEGLGYQWLPPFLGATANVANSQFDKTLSRDALTADVVVLRFTNVALEGHWAFAELPRLREFGRTVIAVLDSTNPWVRARLTSMIGRPCFVIESAEGLAITLESTVPRIGIL